MDEPDERAAHCSQVFKPAGFWAHLKQSVFIVMRANAGLIRSERPSSVKKRKLFHKLRSELRGLSNLICIQVIFSVSGYRKY